MAEAALKDLKYYLANPDEMPTDVKELERLANEQIAVALESGTEEVSVERFVGTDEKPAESSPAPAADTNGKAEPDKGEAEEAPKVDAAVETEAKPDGVLAKDGKNVIPYAVLESARRTAQDATELARDQQQQIADLKATIAAGNKPAEQAPADAGMLTDDELTALEGDSPTLAKVLRAQQATIQKLTGTVNKLESHTRDQIADEETEIKSDIQKAIDATPELAGWQAAEDQAQWNRASAFDKVLRELPEYAEVPFEQRFKKVVEMTKSALSVENAPPAKREPDPKPAANADAVKAAAAAKLKNVTTTPRSLSDIPGGAPPAQSERENVENMSSVALGQKFLSMTKDQMDAYLAGL